MFKILILLFGAVSYIAYGMAKGAHSGQSAPSESALFVWHFWPLFKANTLTATTNNTTLALRQLCNDFSLTLIDIQVTIITHGDLVLLHP